MVIHDDQVRFLRALVHRGDEAALEFGALLAGAKIAARVDAIPQLGVVGEERQLVAVARFGQLFPVADLREPVNLVDSLQDRLALHLMHFLAAEKIRAALHQRGLQIRREVFLQEGNVLLEELLLQRFGRRRNDHAPSAANRGNQIRERLAGAGAGLDHDVLMLRESVVGDLRHRQLRRPEFVSGMALFEQPARPEDSFDGDFLGFGSGSFFRHRRKRPLLRSLLPYFLASLFLCVSVPLWHILLFPRRILEALRPVRQMIERSLVRAVHFERRDGNGAVENRGVIAFRIDPFDAAARSTRNSRGRADPFPPAAYCA